MINGKANIDPEDMFIMKKTLCISLAAAVMCSLAACSSETAEEVSETASAVSTETETEDSVTETSETAGSEQSETEENASDIDLEDNIDDVFFGTSEAVVWYSIDGGTLTEHTENTVPDVMGTEIIDKLVEEGVLFDGAEAVSFERTSVSDGISSNSGGVYEIYHTEGILDMSEYFNELLNQSEEDMQKLYLEAIAQSYKKTYGLDIVDIKCAGMPVITDCINYDEIVSEERLQFAADDSEDSEEEACYIEFDEETSDY